MKTIHAAVAAIALGVAAPGHATLLQNDGTQDFAMAYQISATFASMFAWNTTPDSEVLGKVLNADQGRQGADPAAPLTATPSVDRGTGAELRIPQGVAGAVSPGDPAPGTAPRPGSTAASSGIELPQDGAPAGPTTAGAIGSVDSFPAFVDVTALASFAIPTTDATASRSGDGSGPAADPIGATALPEPGLLQLMGLGMFALATVVGTRSRIADREAV